MSPASSPEPRTVCTRCLRPQHLCLCTHVVRVQNRTGLTILQHPGERRHPFNTARLARLAFENLELRIAWPGLALDPWPAGAALLWPGPGAVELDDLAPQVWPRHLVVLDGTWAQARTLARQVKSLSDLPQVRLSPREPSRYRIRPEPAPHCLSTIESIAAALEVLEPETPDLGRALDAFLAMGDQQTGREQIQHLRRRVRGGVRLMDQLVADWQRLVLCYAEVLQRGALEPIRWAAVRPSTAEVFQDMVVPRAPGFGERWATFAGPRPLLACWSPKALPLLARSTGRDWEGFPLRSAYGNHRRGVQGHLDEITAREGLGPHPVALSGRAGERLGHAWALALFLRDAAGARQARVSSVPPERT